MAKTKTIIAHRKRREFAPASKENVDAGKIKKPIRHRPGVAARFKSSRLIKRLYRFDDYQIMKMRRFQELVRSYIHKSIKEFGLRHDTEQLDGFKIERSALHQLRQSCQIMFLDFSSKINRALQHRKCKGVRLSDIIHVLNMCYTNSNEFNISELKHKFKKINNNPGPRSEQITTD